MVHYFGGSETSTRPGKEMTATRQNLYRFEVPAGTTGLVFNNGSGVKSGDLTCVKNYLYDVNGDKGELTEDR